MEALVLILMVVSHSMFHQQQTAEGVAEVGAQHHRPTTGKRHVAVREEKSWWWSGDYAAVRRRRPVHNRLDP
ncbi:hypothetical protein QJS04_geneDACA004235 [Acorus gramineus]|uniref:Secreted protein n=1 Tax=Acorus gramineus TaxID=55184 RepID=A0AAV9B5N3_ACOGR|nr:hypothetical protein QJS04_geneDACA004235 [Acorus gramineus]